MKCPHCHKADLNKHHILAANNTETYGSNSFTFKCGNCKKKYRAYHIRTVRIDPGMINKVDKNENLSF